MEKTKKMTRMAKRTKRINKSTQYPPGTKTDNTKSLVRLFFGGIVVGMVVFVFYTIFKNAGI